MSSISQEKKEKLYMSGSKKWYRISVILGKDQHGIRDVVEASSVPNSWVSSHLTEIGCNQTTND